MGEQLGTCQIATWPGSTEGLLTLPGEWQEHLKLGERDRVVLRAGNRRVAAEAVFTDEEEVQMTDSIRQRLYLPRGAISVKAWDGELRFGPFVGLYALPSKQPGKPFGELTAVFQDMMKLAEAQGVALFVFLPGEAEWEQGYTTAYVYRTEEKHWVRTKRPLPDLVLPKIMGQPPAWKEKMRRDLAQMAHKVPYGTFSHAVGDKWEVHRLLTQREETRGLLPETKLVKTPLDVEEMLRRWERIYVKPAHGTQGRAIYRLDTEQGGAVRVQFTEHGVTKKRGIQRGGDMWRSFLQSRFCGRRRFLVQQALNLLAVQGGRPVDLRWLVQKDGENCWGVTARVARVGPKGSITTNLHTGGDAVLADDLLRDGGYAEGVKREEMLQRLDEAALQIAAALEARSGRIGELGIDFGLTRAGEIFLIEVNPRPGRQMLKQTAPAVRDLSLQRNLEFAKYVTAF
jgi:hypothetical protein